MLYFYYFFYNAVDFFRNRRYNKSNRRHDLFYFAKEVYMNFHLNKDELSDFSANIRREWAMANGIGGYAGGSVTGACNRTHQGYLIASLHPPVERFLAFTKTNECIMQNENTWNLETAQHAGPVFTEGQKYLEGFDYDGTVTFHYEAGSIRLVKQIALVQGENTAVIAYKIHNPGSAAGLSITPLMNYREHSAASTADTLLFTTEPNEYNGFTLIPDAAPDVKIVLACSGGTLSERKKRFDEQMQYQTEVDNEVDGLDSHYTPYDLEFSIPADSDMEISIICSVLTKGENFSHGTPDAQTAQKLAGEKKQYVKQLVSHAGYENDEFAEILVTAADQFLAYRESTKQKTVLAGLPWFTDWGRDTMIAFSGLTLATKRFAEAREILSTFARYVHHGMVPNMFPDDGQEPFYNTADASLWYFYAVHQYLKYTGKPSDYDFIRTEIYPALREILNAYRNGTDFSIYMDTDGLVHAGSGLDQVTWMDVRVGDWVATPRHGKPVEINALWYNALLVMADLCERFGENPDEYRTLADRVRESFCESFWNPDRQCLYDVVDGETKDDSIRPNQIYAVSLPYTMLPPEQELAVVEMVQKELLAGPGLRSLSRGHKDYHPVYLGSLPKRDAAYHQGTAWGYLMGGFITAYVKVHGASVSARKEALTFLTPVREHLWKGCIGSISEIFDGDSPHTCRGCYAQAWSVGEVLRCYVEDILGK